MASSRLCSIPDCSKPVIGFGYCESHYRRFKDYGDPLAGPTFRGEPQRHFREVVLAYEGAECLPWPYGRASGYGTIFANGRKSLVHRLVCEHFHGSPPTPDHEATHNCGKGHEGCCNKRHLEWKTHQANMWDKVEHGTAKRGKACNFTKLTEEQVRTIRALPRTLSYAKVGKRYGVSPATIGLIVRRENWAWLV